MVEAHRGRLHQTGPELRGAWHDCPERLHCLDEMSRALDDLAHPRSPGDPSYPHDYCHALESLMSL